MPISMKFACSSALVLALLSSCGSRKTGDETSSLDAVSPGHYRIKAVSGKCLDVPDGRTGNGLQVQVWDCHSADMQKFEIKRTQGQYFKILNVATGKALDIKDGGRQNGTIVQQWDAVDGNPNQDFLLQARGAGRYSIAPRVSQRVLDITGQSRSNGAKIQQWTFTGGDNQLWYLERVDGSTSAPAPKPNEIWQRANITYYTSYPDPGSEECLKYNGCTWAGLFAALPEKQTREWVRDHNIIAIHSKDFAQYKLKTFRLRANGQSIEAKVYDMCSDTDCNGCCTENANEGGIGFLIDLETHTADRFGVRSGVAEWTCLDCQ